MRDTASGMIAMKAKELLAKLYPNFINPRYPGGCRGCPWNYNIKVKKLCESGEKEGKTMDQICTICWDQPVSEKSKKYSDLQNDQLSLFGKR